MHDVTRELLFFLFIPLLNDVNKLFLYFTIFLECHEVQVGHYQINWLNVHRSAQLMKRLIL